MHISPYHNLELIITFLFITLFESELLVFHWKYFDQIKPLLMNLDVVWSFSSSNFQGFRNQIHNLFVDDSELMFLFEAMPPGQFHSQTDLFIDLSLTAQNLFGALYALLNILSDFLKGFRDGKHILLDERKKIFDVHLIE